MLLVTVLLGTVSPSPAEVHRWVDADGVIHLDSRGPASSAGPAPTSSTPSVGPSVRCSKLMGRYPRVELFSAKWCGACRMAHDFFERNRIPFTDHDVDDEEGARARYRTLAPDGRLPTAVIGQAVQVGFNEDRYWELLCRGR